MKPKVLVTLHYLVRFQTAWLVRGNGQEQDLDGHYLMDSFGQPYLSGSVVKGKIRDSFNRLVSVVPTWQQYGEFLFGKARNRGGQVYFNEAVLAIDVQPGMVEEQRTRIAMDRFRKIVKDRALVTEKLVQPEIPLIGSIEFYARETDKNALVCVLVSCLHSISSFGAGASIGRGAVEFSYGKPEDLAETHAKSCCWVEETRMDGSVECWSKEKLLDQIQTQLGDEL